MPREPPVTSATRPLSENRSLNMRSSIALPVVLGGAGRRVKEGVSSLSPCGSETSEARSWGGRDAKHRGRVRGLSPRKEPLIRRGFHPRHLLLQGEKGSEEGYIYAASMRRK